MRVTVCGHAGLFVETTSCRILVDPLFADTFAGGAFGFSPARRFDVSQLGPVTHVVVSHGHPDHFHPETLTTFPRDTPVIVPADAHLIAALGRLGFDNVVVLDAGQRFEAGGTSLLATPSAFEGDDEMGVLVTEGDSTFWDIVDTVVTPALGQRLLREHGPLGAVAARYQPIELLAAYQRGLGTAYDYKPQVVDWLECACATEPRFVFPYAFGLAFAEPHGWCNRYAGPLTQHDAVRLFQERLGSADRAGPVNPGDVIQIDGQRVTLQAQASPFVSAVANPVDGFEPVDLSTLPGLDDADDTGELLVRLERFFVSTFQQWLGRERSSLHVRTLFDWQVVWQLAVHLGGDERLHYAMDFRQSPVSLQRRRHPDANYFVHVDGGSLLRVLRGDAGTDLFWRCAAARYHEKILGVRDGHVWAPPVHGWKLFEQLPDPFTLCLRKVEEDRGSEAMRGWQETQVAEFG